MTALARNQRNARTGEVDRPAVAASTSRRRMLRRFALMLSVFALLTLVVALIVVSPRVAWSDLPAIVERLGAWRSSPVAMIAMIGAFLVGGLVVFPVNLLIATSIVAFGPVAGAAIALLGSLASALLLHAIGSLLPEKIRARFAVERVRERIARHGVLAVAIVRLVPIAPYSIVSVAAGAAGIRRVPYLAGTVLGMAPGIALYAIFIDRARAVVADPRPLSWAMLVFAIVLIVVVALLLKRLRGRDARS
jgi:uncharacterized membrane protein YdjX (TVP38/TMEM64 family)